MLDRRQSASSPRIGLSTYREQAAWGVWNEPADLLPSRYADAVGAAGGLAVLLPPHAADPDAAADVVLDGVHGLVLSGGADVDPSRYDAEPHARTGAPRPDRDAWELRLARAALNRDLPLLAICRGMQILNVGLGGDLTQHLPDLVGHEGHSPVTGQHSRHPVVFAPGSRLADLLGARTTVATYHHQALRVLGTGLVATGWAEDETIEAVELPAAGWVIGVQWHPEVHDGAPLFEAFIAACQAVRADAAGYL